MSRRSVAALLWFCVVLLFSIPTLGAQRNEARRVEDAADVFKELVSVPEKEVPDYMMKKARAVAILPRVQKAAFVVGGQWGQGVLVLKNPGGGWSAPVFITIKGGSIGWQIGVQSIDLVLFFHTQKSVDRALAGSFTLGMDVSVAAGSLGRQVGAQTDTDLEAEIYSYARSRGLFAGVTVAGAGLEVDEDANAAYYGKKDVRREDIVNGADLKAPPSTAELRRALDSYVPAGG